MESTLAASGDHELPPQEEITDSKSIETKTQVQQKEIIYEASSDITSQTIDENEAKLKERIAHCKNYIESLKNELKEEKSKLEKEKNKVIVNADTEKIAYYNKPSCDEHYYEDLSSCIESKLSCDENLMEYEKQLEKYQNTLNMAQIEKKNAIRKHMIMKAFKLKLMEVENQCNLELLRVKQSLNCLEPLIMIANKWKKESDAPDDFSYDYLKPLYPEIATDTSVDINSVDRKLNDDLNVDDVPEISPRVTKDCDNN